GDGVSRAILPAFVGGLVQFTQYLDACCDALVVVPFVGAQPAVGEMARSWMVFVFHDDCCLLGFGVTFEVRADQFVIPGPVVLSICCGMYANKSTATADVLLKGRLLRFVEYVAGGAEEHNSFELREILCVEDRGVVGCLYGKSVFAREFFYCTDTCRN